MGKKVYSSGRTASDVAPDRPKTGYTNAQLKQHVGAPICTDATRAKAAVNVRWLCPDDSEEMLDALGLGEPEKLEDGGCPTCGAEAEHPCMSQRHGTPMPKWHVARKRKAGKKVLR